jgi:hypothetical protein
LNERLKVLNKGKLPGVRIVVVVVVIIVVVVTKPSGQDNAAPANVFKIKASLRALQGTSDPGGGGGSKVLLSPWFLW